MHFVNIIYDKIRKTAAVVAGTINSVTDAMQWKLGQISH